MVLTQLLIRVDQCYQCLFVVRVGFFESEAPRPTCSSHPEQEVKLGKRPELHEDSSRAGSSDADSVSALVGDKQAEPSDKDGKKEKPAVAEAAQAHSTDGKEDKPEEKSEVEQKNAKQAAQDQHDSQHVYDAFLAPIEEGVYVRGGMTFHIDPCLWLFAGTEDPQQHHDKSGKGDDFVSRLSILPVLFKPEDGEEAALSTERAYLGACLLSVNYREVRTISERVLQAFEFLRPDVENREIEKFVKSFSDIQYAQVTSKNVPMEIFKDLTHEHCSHPHHWTKWEKEVEKSEGLMVEICA